ncbi:hypothetical protein N7366_11725 [Aeromonas caviae]|uniref:hypothetical protein n=1 Tax=Aeromonas caviae TaxID=648 RepID=UPI002446B4B0|nr:hypothetical protein [Aeromonas caviae]MDH0433917.1 hypothetical protein [Aeromonas caviae]MDH0936765.1 hypothetical protein [Aeromonas caviae]MDH1397575.1 hypothetical protein [Aeromonas caviae]MDH1851969.1 hypothetical protein [Aeromonas caviae]
MREQMENLTQFVATYQAVFDSRLAEYAATDLMSWNDPSWLAGDKGVAWFRQSKRAVLIFSHTEMQGIERIDIDDDYAQFMKAIIILDTFRRSRPPSVATTNKILNILRRWYYEMVKMTGQSHPMYLNSDIIHGAMRRHNENSASSSNVSDYCDIAVSLAKIIRPFNLTLSNIECQNQFPSRNHTNNTKKRKAADSNPDDTDDNKLISIRAFISIIELLYLAKSNGEKIFYNCILLLIITGWRFQELQSIRIDALIRRPLKGDKLLYAQEHELPEYNLGIKYLGAKKSGWRTFWAAPSTIKLIESIFDAVMELTDESRQLLIQYRNSGFTDFLPPSIRALSHDLIEVSELNGLVFSGSGGTRGNAGLRKSMVNAFLQKGVGIKPITKSNPVTSREKLFLFTKKQINDFVELKYAQSKSFHDGYKCTLVIRDNGVEQKFNYEDLLFIAPTSAFGMDHTLVTITNPEPLTHDVLQSLLGGNKKRISIFDKLNLTEDNGERIELNPHIPRHNINTFLAISGLTDHLQAMLMGRIDITQNQFYQHRAESFNYKASSLAIMALNNNPKSVKSPKSEDLGDGRNTSYENDNVTEQSILPAITESGDRRINALAKAAKSKAVYSGIDAAKKYMAIFVDPNLSSEDNLKVNFHTVGESRDEVTLHLEKTISSGFLPDLKRAHDKLLSVKKNELAKELIERHAQLHALPLGACTRDVARWGCPFGMKCQSGGPCGYFTLTGRLDEYEAINIKVDNKRAEVYQLEQLYEKDSSFELALSEQREALLLLEAFQANVIKSFSDRKIVSLISQDKSNPLASIVNRIESQKLVGKTPKTLADAFYIEQLRIEKRKLTTEDE